MAGELDHRIANKGFSLTNTRPREETGAGPAALSGPVRHPDRKQLEGLLSARRRSAASSGRAVRKPGLMYELCAPASATDAQMRARTLER